MVRRVADGRGALASVGLQQAIRKRIPPTLGPCPLQEMNMLHYAVVFFIIALIAAVFGFGGIAAGAVGIAKILFFVFAIMAIVSFVVSLVRKG